MDDVAGVAAGAAGLVGAAGIAGAGLAGVGVDAIAIERVERALARTPTLVDRLFTPQEQADCTIRTGELRVDGLAARFAAKEAVAKALGTGLDGFEFRDVAVVRNGEGRPQVHLAAPALAVAAGRGVGRLHVSLTHTDELAIAFVIAERA